MKNLFIKLLSLSLALLMIFAFVSCKDADKADENKENGDTPADDTADDKGPNDWFDDTGSDDTTDEGEVDDPLDGEEDEFTYDGIWWLTGRGGGFFKKTLKEDGNEFLWKSDAAGKTWKWIIRAGDWSTNADRALEEGTIEAVFTPGANIGIVFGGLGLELPKDGGPNVLAQAGVTYYYAEVKNNGTVSFHVDNGDEAKLNKVNEINISDIIPTFDANADIKLKVNFTKDGNIKIFVNDTEMLSLEGYVPFGTQFGMMVDDCSNLEAGAFVGTLKSFTYASPEA